MKKPLMIYTHTPFCHHHCPYCDFFVVAQAKKTTIQSYIQAMLSEIDHFENDGWSYHEVRTIFLGGGTPSLLESIHLEAILSKLSQHFSMSDTCEITLETNPEDITLEKSLAWKHLGINRISLGVQSLDDTELKILERQHTCAEVTQGIDTLIQAGFNNISLDLMFALPQQSLLGLERTLKKAVTLPVTHISAYNLTIEERTRYYSQHKKGLLNLPNDELQRDMYSLVRQTLSSSHFLPYEISNFSKNSNSHSKHNRGYWNGQEYWGIGAAAHSFQKTHQGFTRWWNHKNLQTYLSQTKDRTVEHLSPSQHFMERLFTGLRQTEGIHVTNIACELGVEVSPELSEKFSEMVSLGYLHLNDQTYALTEAGILISDTLFSQIFET